MSLNFVSDPTDHFCQISHDSILLSLSLHPVSSPAHVVVAAALTLTFFLPMATRWTMQQIRQQALLRADATPMLIGTKGSSVGLTLHALYFRGDAPPSINYSQLERLDALKLARSLPLLTRFRTQGHTIVGTTNEYLAFRNLNLSSGEPLADWGDCLVGASAARELDVAVGDSLLSEPENMLDLAGPAPLRLRIRGILAPTGSSDDEVIFCHLETTWIMAASAMVIACQRSPSHNPQTKTKTKTSRANRFIRTNLRTCSVTPRSPQRIALASTFTVVAQTIR